jgi:sulfur-oxidizing protein SoxA
MRVLAAVAAAALVVLAAIPGGTSRAADPSADPRRSGFEFMTSEVRAMQQDDALNPGMLWIEDGEALWNRNAGAADRSCASCHGAAAPSMRGVAARYPAFDETAARPLSLAQRINVCRAQHQRAAPLAAESDELLALEGYVAHQSRGMPVTPPNDARLEPFRARGESLYRQRIGQLAFSCAQCHDEHAGRRLGGSVIPQAHPTGYPVYRLEWQGLGSLERRLRGCMSGVRAEPFAYGSAELVELELYLAQRAVGLRIETPAVRP